MIGTNIIQLTVAPATKLVFILVIGSIFATSVPIHIQHSQIVFKEAEARNYKKKRYKTKRKSKRKTLDDLMVEQKSSNKWAAIVVDANRGKIVYEDNAEKQRHPASLTKMMTLYLLFEAIEKRKMSGKTLMRVSRKAASQPQTNISLKKGNRITASQAIRALVVRSANDVAVVVAEHLGGSVSGFARQMNRKARELGMSKTKFYNPHGLPDKRQVTTALDMAKLSIALKRDFPGYYHHFKRTSFRFKRKTYKSHNRVVGKLPGADGIKTGYIRASGFNLATSITRGKTRLVGVILGGMTSAARDQEMIDMLDRTLPIARKQAEEARLAKIRADQLAKEEAERLARIEAERAARASERIEVADIPTSPVPIYDRLDRKAPYLAGKNWAVQVGAFPTVDQAERAAAVARRIAPTYLSKAKLHISQVSANNRIFNRSRLLYLTAQQARYVCDQLTNARKQCMVVKLEG